MSKSYVKKDNSKLINIFILIGIGFLVLSLALMITNGNKSENHLVEIDYAKYSEILKEDKYNIILLTTPTCSHCVNYKPYVNYVADENNLTIYNINLNNLEFEQYVEIHDKYSATNNQFDEVGNSMIPTPVTVIVKNGEEVTSVLGDIGYSGLQKLLKKYNIIK